MKLNKKLLTLLVSFLVIAVFAVGGTVAFLYTTDGPKTNVFTPSQVTTKVEETISGTTKSNVMIKNTGDTDAWIRAYVVITWQDKDGNVYGQMPVKGTHYTDWNLGNNWIPGEDGFYYYKKPVAPDGMTDVLIASISQTANSAPAADYYLNVEIIGSGLQSVPDDAFETAWASSELEIKVAADGTRYLAKKQGGTE